MARSTAPAWGAAFSYLMLYTRVLRIMLRCCCYTQGFYERISHNAAIRKGFKEFISQIFAFDAIRKGFKEILCI